MSAITTAESRELFFDHPRVIASMMRAAGFEVELSEDEERATWVAPDGTPMEAIEFVQCRDLQFRDYENGYEATVIQPVGAGLAGYFTRVMGPWGEYRYPAGKDPVETGIQLMLNSIPREYGEIRPALTPEEEAAFYDAADAEERSTGEDPEDEPYVLPSEEAMQAVIDGL